MRFLLFAVTATLSAYLLFWIEPLAAKYILPTFGGSASVWMAALVFFQFTLLLGYLYAMMLTRFSLQRQKLLHLLLIFAAIGILGLRFGNWPSPPMPELFLRYEMPAMLGVFLVLAKGIGLPFFVLSATSTLLQHWYSQFDRGRVWQLYAFSNAGSLAGIVAYPFLLEPRIKILLQGDIWTVLFFAICGMLTICTLTAGEQNKKVEKADAIDTKSYSSWKTWVVLPILTSWLLLSTTRELTTSVAPVPFLWLLPLGLYLVSFILAFRKTKTVSTHVFHYIFLLSMIFILAAKLSGHVSIPTTLILYSVFLFSGFLVSHTYLYESRPNARALALFYLFISLGGALGSLIPSIITPLLMKQVMEFISITFGIYIVVAFGLLKDSESLFARIFNRFFSSNIEKAFFVVLIFFAFFISYFILNVQKRELESVAWYRNFYSELRVMKRNIDGTPTVGLYHGSILHGLQAMEGDLRFTPIGYYSKSTPLYSVLGGSVKSRRNIAVFGLGPGVLAAYTKEGDVMDFYEINPDVVKVASDNFTYLSDAKGKINVILGDARLTLAQQPDKKYDVIVLDAFSDDAIPVHLLTDEAFSLYEHSLRDPASVIAVNISNGYIDLKPVLAAIAQKHNFAAVTKSSIEDNKFYLSSEWVLLSRSSAAISSCEGCGELVAEPILWTDDFSNLMAVLKRY